MRSIKESVVVLYWVDRLLAVAIVALNVLLSVRLRDSEATGARVLLAGLVTIGAVRIIFGDRISIPMAVGIACLQGILVSALLVGRPWREEDRLTRNIVIVQGVYVALCMFAWTFCLSTALVDYPSLKKRPGT